MPKYLKFWGTRGSCPVSGLKYTKFGGNTCCLELCYDDFCFIFDAGTGIRPLGEELAKQNRSIYLFLSHFHWDHVIGFPFFDPLYSAEKEMAIWSPGAKKKSCREVFEELLSIEFFPLRLDQLRAKLHFHSIEEKKSVSIGPLTIHFHKTCHPSLTFGFKIQSTHWTIGYVTDNELFQGYHGDFKNAPKDPQTVEFFTGCDLLIHEAQYLPEEYRKKVGWGHSSVTNAAALIYQAKIKRWLVVHHDPKHTDEELRRLEALALCLFKDNSISCIPEWVGDGHVVPLQ